MEIFLSRSRYFRGSSIMLFKLLKGKNSQGPKNKYGSFKTAELVNVLKVFSECARGKKGTQVLRRTQ